MEVEKLLRYVILIACLLVLNVLFYIFLEFGRKSVHTGLLLWLMYGGYRLSKQYLQKR